MIDMSFRSDLVHRPRRNRSSAAIRDLVQEHRLHPADFIVPLFVVEGNCLAIAIEAMPGAYCYSVDRLCDEVKRLFEQGIRGIDLFAVTPKHKKDPLGCEALNSVGLLQTAVYHIKKAIPEMCVMADVALDPYTSHGHDGVIDAHGYVLNDPTLDALGKMSLSLAQAGVDVVSPSDMMDGRVKHIRSVLDNAGYINVGILAYTAKYASAFYGPFRQILDSGVTNGDKKSYQMNPANIREAMREAYLDVAEGADFLLIKPALPYLDVIAKIKEGTHLPIAAYHVSGEYAMLLAAAEKGWVDLEKALVESYLCIKRAGAEMIFTYGFSKIQHLFNP